MKQASILSAALAVAMALLACGSDQPVEIVEFTTVERGTGSHYDSDFENVVNENQPQQPFLVVCRTAEEFAVFWERHKAGLSPPRTPPDVDFDAHDVVAAMDRVRPHISHSMTVLQVFDLGPSRSVEVESHQFPGAHPASFSQPFHIVLVPKSENSYDLTVDETTIYDQARLP